MKIYHMNLKVKSAENPKNTLLRLACRIEEFKWDYEACLDSLEPIICRAEMWESMDKKYADISNLISELYEMLK